MIDAESIIFTRVATALRGKFPGIFVTGEKVSAPASWPCTSILEIANTVYRRSQDSDSVENHAEITYEIEHFSNLSPGRKSQCKAMAATADEVMRGLNFTRVMLTPVDNIAPNIARYVGRYRAVISSTGQIYRR